MSELSVYLFGKLRAQRGDNVITSFGSSKVQELFCYLLLHRSRPHSRESLSCFLWPDVPSPQAKKYLRQALWQLRIVLNGHHDNEHQLVRVEPEWVHVNADGNLWLDVHVFEQVFDRIRGVDGKSLDAATVAAMQNAVQLYRADLLEDWYEDWCIQERERLQQMWITMLDKLMEYAEIHHQYEAGLVYGAQILRYDPARELTHCRLMRLHFLSGDRTAALRQFDHCVASLQQELGVVPAGDTVALYEQIRADRVESAVSSSYLGSVKGELGVLVPTVREHLQELHAGLARIERQVRRDMQLIEEVLRASGAGRSHLALDTPGDGKETRAETGPHHTVLRGPSHPLEDMNYSHCLRPAQVGPTRDL